MPKNTFTITPIQLELLKSTAESLWQSSTLLNLFYTRIDLSKVDSDELKDALTGIEVLFNNYITELDKHIATIETKGANNA